MSIKTFYNILISPHSWGELNAGLVGWEDQSPEFLRYHLVTYHLFQSDQVSYMSA